MTDTPKTIFLKDYEKPPFTITEVHLTFDLFEDYTLVTATSQITDGKQKDIFLAGNGLELVSLELNNKPVSQSQYNLDPHLLVVRDVPTNFQLTIQTKIKPQDNKALEGLYKSSGKFCTQCEPEGFRRITYFLDRPDVMATYTTKIIADKESYPILLANGNKVEEGDLASGRHFAVWKDPFPKPSYLFALVAGKLVSLDDTWTTPSGRTIKLQLFVEAHELHKTDFAMQALKDSMKWEEDVYGLEYDLDIYMIVAIGDFNMGAMENKGLNIFNSKYVLANSDTATDVDYEGIQGVIGHEYFHNWSGNRITCRDWFQLSLKEGLTVFRDQEFSADLNSRTLKRIDDVAQLRASQFPEDSGPMSHPVRPESYIEINNFYTPTIYNKGAEVIRMMHSLMGPTTYRKATDLYFQRHDGEAVTIDDFAACMEEASGLDLTQFKLWYSQAGTPKVKAHWDWRDEGGIWTLHLSQENPDTAGQTNKKPQVIPIRMGLLDSTGRDMPFKWEGQEAKEHVIPLSKKEQSFTFTDLKENPTPSLVRSFSAPVYLSASYTRRDLAFLMTFDSDGFNRYEAAQILGTQVIEDLLGQLEQQQELQVPESYMNAIGLILDANSLDPNLKAKIITPPSRTHLLNLMGKVDIAHLWQATFHLEEAIGRRFHAKLISIYNNHNDSDWEFTPKAVGRRALKNTALRLIARANTPEGLDLVTKQMATSSNMTDSISALRVLTSQETDQRHQYLESFYQKWQKDPLVIDKWFQIQAASEHKDILSHVKGLLNHQDYDTTNPNRVFSLLRPFCNPNPNGFHHASGDGYKIIGDQVLAIDPHNPSLSARLANALIRWRHYNEVVGQKMKTQLERIMATDGLSKDVYEIVSKSLKDG